MLLQEHSRFVNAVRFSPDGALLCSVSSDGKAVLYDGSTGETKGLLGGDKAHSGGIYAVSGEIGVEEWVNVQCAGGLGS